MTAPAVTERNSALCSADLPGALPERETGESGPGTLHSAITEGDRGPLDTREWLRRFGAYCTPPSPLTERRPSMEQMVEYARRARYTSNLHGPVRAVGVAWCYLVAIPAAVCSRFREWLWERPARAVTVLATVKLLTFLPPVAWGVEHVVEPTVRGALWLFL